MAQYMQINFNNGEESKQISLVTPTSETVMVSFNMDKIIDQDRILISGSLLEVEHEEYIKILGAEKAFEEYFNFFEDMWEELRKIPCSTIKNIAFYKDDMLLYTTKKSVKNFAYDLNIFEQRVTIQIICARTYESIVNEMKEE